MYSLSLILRKLPEEVLQQNKEVNQERERHGMQEMGKPGPEQQ